MATMADFLTAINAAWNGDRTLFWTQGDVVLTAPIVLMATSNRTGFKLQMNGAKLICAFNDATKAAISMVIPATSYGVNIRNWQFDGLQVVGTSPFLGALYLECHTNRSWMYAGLIRDVRADGHSGHAIVVSGSVFEFVMDNVGSTQGLGGFRAVERGAKASDPTGADSDRGLPSAMYLYRPNFRDFNGNTIELASSTPYRECFDLSIRDGYLVSGLGQGYAVSAPAGLTEISGTGIENVNGGAGIFIGYRGGRVINVRGANPIANATLSPKRGMAYLVDCFLAGGALELRGASFENEVSGTGMRLARVTGGSGGTVYLDPSRSSKTGADIDGDVPAMNYRVVAYGPKS